MKYPSFFVLMCLSFIKVSHAVDSSTSNFNSKLDAYLNKQSNFEEILDRTNLVKQDAAFEVQSTTTIKHRGSYKYASIFFLFDNGYILLDNQLHSLTSQNGTYGLAPLNVTFQKWASDEILFTKFIEYKNAGTLLIRLKSGEAPIYALCNNSGSFIQSLFIPESSDAHFFTNSNNLYLIVLNNKKDNLAITSVYKWLGSHFDEIQTIFTIGAIKVSSFSTKTSEILIILQTLPNRTVFSETYQFQNEKIFKTQRLSTQNPVNLDTFKNHNKNYVVIYETSKNNTVFYWNGYQLLKYSVLETDTKVNHRVISSVKETPLLITPAWDKIQVYQLFPANIKVAEHCCTSNYSAILHTQGRENGSSLVTFTVSLNDNNTIDIDVMTFKVHFDQTEVDSAGKEYLRECFNNLEQKVFAFRRRQNETRGKLVRYKLIAENNARSTYSDSVIGESLQKGTSAEIKLDALQGKLNSTKSLLGHYEVTQGNLTVNGELVLRGTTTVKNLTANNINLKRINGQKWTPEQWLKYEEPQMVTGAVSFTSIVTEKLEPSEDDPLFQNLLLKDGDQTITGSISVKGTLSAGRISTEKINNILLSIICLKNDSQAIKGLKTFKNLEADEAKIDLINERAPEHLLANGSSMSNLFVKHLAVETINDVPWDEFRSSVFRVGSNQIINGSLNFQQMKTTSLNLRSLNGVDVDNFLTRTTDQVIDADIRFNRIFAENITADFVNGINLPEEAVVFDEPVPIKGPVTFDKLNVLKDLTLSGDIDNSLFYKGKHIIGTNESDLLQVYSGNVTIRGNVTLNNLILHPHETRFIVGEEEIFSNISDTYWTKNTEQKIPVRPTAYQGLNAPHIMTSVLNGVNFNQYMRNIDENTIETDYRFESVTVLGNVILSNTAKHRPDLKKIVNESIQTSGSFVINGKKTYANVLKAENFATLKKLEGIDALDTVNTKWSREVTGTKTFKNLIIKKDLISSIDRVDKFNDIDINEFLKNLIFIDEPQKLESLNFKFLNATNLSVSKINGHPIEEYKMKLDHLRTLDKIETLIINGNISISNAKNVSTINDIPIEDFVDSAASRVGETGAFVMDVTFTEKVEIDNLFTNFINDVDLKNLTSRFLVRNFRQNITAPFTFTNIKSGNIITPKINEVSVGNMIDISSKERQDLYVPRGLKLMSATVTQSLDSTNMIPCNFGELLEKINNPQTQNWFQLVINGNVTLLDEESTLYRIFEKSVQRSKKNVITAPVHFTNNVIAESIEANKDINDITLDELFQDAVLTDSDTEQVISGTKWFTTMQVTNAVVNKDADIPVVNNRNVAHLSKEIVDKNDVEDTVIQGMKIFFGGLQTNKFYSTLVANVDPGNIVNLESPGKIYEATFDRLVIENNLNVNFVNNMNATHILESRLLLSKSESQETNAIYFFENIEIQNLTTPSINDVTLEEIVYDDGEMQNVSGQKRFLKKVEVFGNLAVDFVNGINISKEYQDSLTSDDFVVINGSVIVLEPSSINGSVSAESINGFPISTIYDILNSSNAKTEVEEIYDFKNQLVDTIKHSMRVVQGLPVEFMYIEKSDSLQISVPNAMDASTVTSKNFVLVHVNGEESGDYCGLPSTCHCPVQYTVEISPERSVTVFPNKGSQRVFSYDDKSMIVHFITTSVSSSTECRTGTTRVMNEVSMMTWSTLPTSNAAGGSHQYNDFFTGYISKVVFFTLNGKSYCIIGRYYDPVTDSYDLDSILIRFNENRTLATEVQTIETKGAREVYLFHTAQGVRLVIGNMKAGEEETQIYTFDEAREQFIFLRTIPFFGCSAAKAVVLGADSLIVLRHRYAPVQILKYYPEFRNYYHYQSLEIEEPVINISVFYSAGFGISDAYLCMVTANETYQIHSYKLIEGWKLESTGKLEGLRNLIPLEINEQSYLFAPSSKNSSLLTIIKNGSP